MMNIKSYIRNQGKFSFGVKDTSVTISKEALKKYEYVVVVM